MLLISMLESCFLGFLFLNIFATDLGLQTKRIDEVSQTNTVMALSLNAAANSATTLQNSSQKLKCFVFYLTFVLLSKAYCLSRKESNKNKSLKASVG